MGSEDPTKELHNGQIAQALAELRDSTNRLGNELASLIIEFRIGRSQIEARLTALEAVIHRWLEETPSLS